MGVHRTCGEPNEIESTTIGVKLNGLRGVAYVCGEACDVVPGGGVAHLDVVHGACSRTGAVVFVGWVFFLSSLGGQAPHVLRAPMGVHRTCGEPNEIEWTPMGVKVNGWGCVAYLW